jgi:hypothetical protein
MLKWLWHCFFGSPSRITRADAVALAERFAAEESLPFNKPYVANEGREWLVYLTGNRTPSAWVLICQETGEIIQSGKGSR